MPPLRAPPSLPSIALVADEVVAESGSPVRSSNSSPHDVPITRTSAGVLAADELRLGKAVAGALVLPFAPSNPSLRPSPSSSLLAAPSLPFAADASAASAVVVVPPPLGLMPGTATPAVALSGAAIRCVGSSSAPADQQRTKVHLPSEEVTAMSI